MRLELERKRISVSDESDEGDEKKASEKAREKGKPERIVIWIVACALIV